MSVASIAFGGDNAMSARSRSIAAELLPRRLSITARTSAISGVLSPNRRARSAASSATLSRPTPSAARARACHAATSLGFLTVIFSVIASTSPNARRASNAFKSDVEERVLIEDWPQRTL